MTRDSLVNIINYCTDLLRSDDGISGSMHYTEVLSWLMFLKFLDDKEKELELEAELNFEDFEHLIDEEYRWSSWATSKELTGADLITFVNKKLIPYLSSLQSSSETDRKQIISAIFKEVNNRVQSGYILKDVLLKIDEIQFNSNDDIHTMSLLYESLLQKMGDDGGTSGEFYTPRPVIRTTVEMVQPQIGGTVYDPSMGSGGFLTESYEYMKEQADTPEKVKILSENTFYGQEKTPLAYLLGLMNMLLHGIDYPRVIKTNTLSKNIREIDEASKRKYIMANPPFGGKEHESIQSNFPVEAQATELLFLQYIMKMLQFDGKSAVVVPEGVLFRINGPYKTIKTQLLEEFNLHTVVSLPAGVFLPYSAVKTSILFFDRTEPTKDVWFYEVPLLNEKRLTKNNGISKEHFTELLSLYKDRKMTEHSWLVSVEEILKNDTNISAAKYNPHQEKEEELLEPEEYAEEILDLLNSASQNMSKLLNTTGDNANEYDDSTGSSDEYLNHIKRTKQELIQQKKVKTSATDSPVLPEEIPFELPEGWKWKKLIDITEKLGAGSTPKGGQKVYQESGVKFIRSQNVWNEGLKTDNIAFISEEINNKMKNSIVEPKDVLLNITGASIGRCCIVPSTFDIGNVNQHVCIIRLIDKDFGEFLHKWMISKYVQERIMSVQAGVSREGLSIGNLSNFIVPIPPKNVQKKIVERLNYESAIHEKTLADIVKIENKIKQMRKSLFQKAFSEELVKQRLEERTGQELLDSILQPK